MTTSGDIQQARTLRWLGATLDEIAAELGVNRDTVSHWLNPAAHRRHVTRNREWRIRQRERREQEILLARLIEMRRLGASYNGIAYAVQAFTGRRVTGDTIKSWLSKADPTLPKKPRGKAFTAAR